MCLVEILFTFFSFPSPSFSLLLPLPPSFTLQISGAVSGLTAEGGDVGLKLWLAGALVENDAAKEPALAARLEALRAAIAASVSAKLEAAKTESDAAVAAAVAVASQDIKTSCG